jgi:hypothetical protein
MVKPQQQYTSKEKKYILDIFMISYKMRTVF